MSPSEKSRTVGRKLRTEDMTSSIFPTVSTLRSPPPAVKPELIETAITPSANRASTA